MKFCTKPLIKNVDFLVTIKCLLGSLPAGDKEDPMLRNIIGAIVGLIVGGIVNMGLIMISSSIIPPPAGVDMTTVEGVTAAMPLLEPKHFVFPFLAHALGTFAAALIACLIAVSHKMAIGMVIGVLFLLGGIAASMMIPAPTWFKVLDLVVAYIPMALLGAKLGGAGKATA